MKMKNRYDQEILEVLHYDNGPQVYGFVEKEKTYLAVKQNEDDTGNNSWLMVPLSKEDKNHYEALRQNLLTVDDFIKDRPQSLVTFNVHGDVIKNEKK